jgi:hypothetical protein
MTGKRALIAVLVALPALPAAAAAHSIELQPVLSGQPAGSMPVNPIRPAGCPATVDPTSFTSTNELYNLDAAMARYGPRPTGSPAHEHFIDWLQRSMATMPGMRLGSVSYSFRRWTEKSAALSVHDGSPAGPKIAISSTVPYAKPTAPVTAPLVYVPSSSDISAANVRGKIVVRDFVPVSIPNAAFAALQWWTWDPNLTLTKTFGDNYVREYLSTQRELDLSSAAGAGAAGLVFVHQLPSDQVRGIYAPYDGIYWGVPAVYVGVDEGQRLKQAASAGRRATLKLQAAEAPATTRMLVDTLPGVSAERLIVASHTDGMNAVWDNGPISMLALARHFSSLPLQCRPRTLQFVFTTGHLFQALGGPGSHDGSARLEAQQLNQDYAKGTVAAVMTVEHMGARAYTAVPRPGGKPGSTLVPTGGPETNSFFFGESPAISEAVQTTVVRDNLTQTIALRGADLPSAHIPMHQSFGGEGGPYHQKLIPTIAFVTGPWTLFGTGFSTDQMLDKDLMHQQTLVFADILHAIEVIPREALAGGYLAERGARSVVCASPFVSVGLANCDDNPTGPIGSPQWLTVANSQWLSTISKLETVH